MKKILFNLIVLVLLTVITGCSGKNEKTDLLDEILSRGKIIAGVKFDTKPFGYINEKQELDGFDVDVAKYIAKSILGSEKKIEFVQVTPSNRIQALNSNKIDIIIATMTITNQRSEIIDFSVPYYIAGQAILVKKESKIKSLSDLNNKKIIVVFGSTAENNLRLKLPGAKITGFKTYSNAYTALKEGRADAMAADDSILIGLAMSDSSVKLLPARYTKEPYAVGFRKDYSTVKLRKKINFILKEMKSSGKLDKLRLKHIKYNL